MYLIFCKNSAGYQDKSSVSQIWYQCQVYENCQQILKFQYAYIHKITNNKIKHVYIYIHTQANQYRFMRDDKTSYVNKYIQVIHTHVY
jgi:hypothetical protein